MEPDAVADDIAEQIDLSQYADPNVEAIKLYEAARGDARRLAAIVAELQREEQRGWCNILLMTDDIAVVRWIDDFVITIKDQALVAPLAREA